MTVLRAFSIILGSAVGFAFAGMVLGVVLATATPDYYPTVFGTAQRGVRIDPVQVGMGLGLSQGAMCGVIVGGVVVLAVAIASRRQPPAFLSTPGGSEAPSSTAVRKP